MDISDNRLRTVLAQHPVAMTWVYLKIPAEPLRQISQLGDGHQRILAPAHYQDRAVDAIRMEVDVTVQEIADQINGLGNHAPAKICLLGFRHGAEPKATKIPLFKTKRAAERHQERILQAQEAKGPRRSRLELPGRRAGQKHQGGYRLRLGRLLRHQPSQTMSHDNRRKRRAADDPPDIFHASGKAQLLESGTRPLFEPPAKIYRPTLPPEIAEMASPPLPAPGAAPQTVNQNQRPSKLRPLRR